MTNIAGNRGISTLVSTMHKNVKNAHLLSYYTKNAGPAPQIRYWENRFCLDPSLYTALLSW